METVIDLILEIVFEAFIEGAMDASVSRRVPLAVRIILLAALVLLYGGLVYVCIRIAISQKSLVALAIGIFILVIVILAVRKKYKEHYGSNADA